MKKRRRKHNTIKNKIVAAVLLFLAWAMAQISTDRTASVFIIIFFVVPLLTAKKNMIY